MRYFAPLLCLICGCSFFMPPQIIYHNDLLPQDSGQGKDVYSVEAAVITFALEGLRVKVEPMNDEALNALFVEDSAKGQFSTNPYTYGNWVDPLLGYSPKRFTVFRVTVNNDIYAKVLIDPLKAVLHTDRGEVLYSYGIPSFSPHSSFERYYRTIRGQSGNEFYRFDLRMGNVRSSAYLTDQHIFKGESYGGLIVFDPLDVNVGRVQLVLRDLVFKFDASGQPLESVNVTMDFVQQVETREVVDGAQ